MYTYIYISDSENPIRRRIREREERARSRAHVVFMSSSNSSVFDMVFDAAAPFTSSSAHSYTTAPRGVADALAGWAERAAAHDPDDECRRCARAVLGAVAQPTLYFP